MDWTKNRLKLILLLVIVLISTSLLANDPMPQSHWDEATKDLHYQTEEPEEDAPSQEFEPPNIEASPVFSYILIAILGILVLFIILKVATKKTGNEKIDPNAVEDYALEEVSDDLHEHDLRKNLATAIEKQDYRAAVRIYYLLVIQLLDYQQQIDWKRDKTNRDYIREMGQHPTLGTFKKLTYNYEYVWYGELNLQQQEFKTLAPSFESYIKTIEVKDEQ